MAISTIHLIFNLLEKIESITEKTKVNESQYYFHIILYIYFLNESHYWLLLFQYIYQQNLKIKKKKNISYILTVFIRYFCNYINIW